MSSTIEIVSLLQPPPETVALFDELILIDSGRVMYAGPLDDVVGHFESLGYVLPERTDVADWLLSLPTKGGAQYLADENAKHLTTSEFKEKYDGSVLGKGTRESNEKPLNDDYKLSNEEEAYFKTRYHNSTYKSMKLLVSREMLLWW
jgi:ABC-type multidrug transport system ATPase subunit